MDGGGINLLGGLEIKALSGKVIIESVRLMITSEIQERKKETDGVGAKLK